MFKLPPELTIAQVEECKSQLIEYIDQHEEVALDDSDVSRIDTVGVQLLLAVVSYIASQNKILHWQSQSSILSQSIQLLGINEPIMNQYFNG